MSLKHELDSHKTWFSQSPGHPIVLSTRAKLVRNIAGYTFPDKLDAQKQEELSQKVALAVLSTKPDTRIDLSQMAPLVRKLASERFLASLNTLQKKQGTLWLSKGETQGIFWRGKDHLSLFALTSGLAISKTISAVHKQESLLSSSLNFATLPGWGYLSSCPEQTGSGLQISLLLHLPGAVRAGMFDQILRSIEAQGYSLNAFWAQGRSRSESDFFLLTNQFSCGQLPQTQIEITEDLARQIISFEEMARRHELSKNRRTCFDRCGRAWGILTQARFLTWDESADLLAILRSSCEFAIIPEIALSLSQIDWLLFHLQDANLSVGWPKHPEGETAQRADIIRNMLTAGRTYV